MRYTLISVSLIVIGCVAQSPIVPPPTQTSVENKCKDPPIIKRRIDGDVRAASPFYVVAMTENPRTQQIDNVCYTYFENNNVFLHIISVVFKNGTSSQAVLFKHDIDNEPGRAVATGHNCTFHDFTLTPVCSGTVFPLYRCYLSGACSQLDVDPVLGVDVRLVLAATPILSDSCVTEIKTTLTNTTYLDGDHYVILPQLQKHQCVTKYTINSINSDHALGSISLIQ